MITVLSDIKEIIENKDGPIFIWGAGIYGDMIGSFMERANIDFEGFIDSKWGGENIRKGRKQVNTPDILNKYEGKDLRIIISPKENKDILLHLYEIDKNNDLTINCVTPMAYSFDGERKYDINAVLGYFRKIIINREPPTIISNDCIAGIIYKDVGVENITLSPTINTSIAPKDYIKIAKNPKYYLSCDAVPSDYEVFSIDGYTYCVPCASIRDVKIRFTHSKEQNGMDDINKYCKRWNYMARNIKWDRCCFVVRVHTGVDSEFMKALKEIKYPYRVISYNEHSPIEKDNNAINNTLNFGDWNIPLEQYGFDFIDWYNDLLNEIECKK